MPVKKKKNSDIYTVVQKFQTLAVFANNFNKYWSALIIFGTENL